MDSTKMNLGTTWNFTDRGRDCYTVDVDGHRVGRKLGAICIRVTRHPLRDGWTVDRHPGLGPWECLIDGPFETKEAAAAALVARARARKVG